MRRLFWVGVGAAGAVFLAQKARRAVQALPETMAGQVEEAGQRASSALRTALADFRTARAERELALVDALLVEPVGGTQRRPRSSRTPQADADVGRWDDDEEEDDDF